MYNYSIRMNQLVKDYLERVQTYSIDKWIYLVKGLSPYKLSRMGYVCLDFFLLQCVSC